MKALGQVVWQMPSEDAEFRWGYEGDDLIAEWDGVLRLRATRSGALKALEPWPGTAEEIVRKTQRGAAAAFLRARRRQHSLHASAVSWRDHAIVCIGESGAGKSTVAERLCQLEAVRLLSDDIAAIEQLPGGWHLLPSEDVLWLAGGGSRKTPTRPACVEQSPVRILCVAQLAFEDGDGALQVSELRGGDAGSCLLRSLVRFELTPALRAVELEIVGSVLSQARMLRIVRSPNVSPEAVAGALLAAAGGHRP